MNLETIMTDAPRNPRYESAMTRDDVQANVNFVTLRPGHEVVRRGKFLGLPAYDEEPRWSAPAQIDGTVVDVSLYDLGITPDGSGEWPVEVTIIDGDQA